jgi:DNA-binding NarL/FixJ family response regulator
MPLSTGGPEAQQREVLAAGQVEQPAFAVRRHQRGRIGCAISRAQQGGLVTIVAQGCSTQVIAGRLHLSPDTVGHHVTHMLREAEALNRPQLVALAYVSGKGRLATFAHRPTVPYAHQPA